MNFLREWKEIWDMRGPFLLGQNVIFLRQKKKNKT